jgi:enoyl-[acyl-carrier protein] reductase/trans-2-enoyl-CoA reductase (NAD+)
VKQEALARVAASGVKLDCVIYSLAAPKRTDPKTGASWNSALKPIGTTFRSPSINLGNDQIQQVEIGPASDAEIEATRKVMGGEDFVAWVTGAADADCWRRAAAWSPTATSGPSGRCRSTVGDDRQGQGGSGDADGGAVGDASGAHRRRAYVSVNKALVDAGLAAIRWCRFTSARFTR